MLKTAHEVMMSADTRSRTLGVMLNSAREFANTDNHAKAIEEITNVLNIDGITFDEVERIKGTATALANTYANIAEYRSAVRRANSLQDYIRGPGVKNEGKGVHHESGIFTLPKGPV